MPAIRTIVDDDPASLARTSKELGLDRCPTIHTTADLTVQALRKGMKSGRTSLMLLIPAFHDGQNVCVVAETSLNAWMMATSVLRAKFEDEVNIPGWAVFPDSVRDVLRPRYAEAIRRVRADITPEQATEMADMFMDAVSAGAPDEYFENP